MNREARQFYEALGRANPTVGLPDPDMVSHLAVDFTPGDLSVVTFAVVGLEIPMPPWDDQ